MIYGPQFFELAANYGGLVTMGKLTIRVREFRPELRRMIVQALTVDWIILAIPLLQPSHLSPTCLISTPSSLEMNQTVSSSLCLRNMSKFG